MPAGASQPDNSARKAQRSFSALDWKERARLIAEAEARQLKYHNRIMPMTQRASLFPDDDDDGAIETTEQAQRALLLECYYGLLELTLKGQEQFLPPWTTTKDPAERDRAAADLRRRADAENARLQAVQQRGDWRPLKETWRGRIPTEERVHDPEPGSEDWLHSSYRTIRETLDRRSSPYDYQRTVRLLALVPDETAPVSAASLDPDPPLL